jgi:hypothetical protein
VNRASLIVATLLETGEVSASHSIGVVYESGPTWKSLKKNEVEFTPQERKQIKKLDGASWIKAVINGKTWYVCYTHRAASAKPTLRGAIASYKYIETTG